MNELGTEIGGRHEVQESLLELLLRDGRSIDTVQEMEEFCMQLEDAHFLKEIGKF